MAAITGASAGIGRATAVRLARDGASVAICARTGARLEPVAAAIEQAGGLALSVVADVTRERDMQSLVDQTVARFGHLDVMVCNAGFGIAGVIDQIEPDEMRRLVDVNYLGSDIHVTIVFPVSTTTEFFGVMERETGVAISRSPGPTQTADQVADAIAAAIARPVPEVYPHAAARGLVWLNAIAPGFCDRIIRKYGRKPLPPGGGNR